jgi:hypothetical protein
MGMSKYSDAKLAKLGILRDKMVKIPIIMQTFASNLIKIIQDISDEYNVDLDYVYVNVECCPDCGHKLIIEVRVCKTDEELDKEIQETEAVRKERERLREERELKTYEELKEKYGDK